MKPDLRTREAKAAQAYMQAKGYRNLAPHRVIKIEDQACWYFYYRVEGGMVELEVLWEDLQWKYSSFYEPTVDPQVMDLALTSVDR